MLLKDSVRDQSGYFYNLSNQKISQEYTEKESEFSTMQALILREDEENESNLPLNKLLLYNCKTPQSNTLNQKKKNLNDNQINGSFNLQLEVSYSKINELEQSNQAILNLEESQIDLEENDSFKIS